MNGLGVYLHIPFCDGKCPYCDFYSLPSATPLMLDQYTDALIRSVTDWSQKTDLSVDSVYFGGGTPSMLGASRLSRVMNCIRDHFTVSPDAEITMEVNPTRNLEDVLSAFYAGGGNRLSVGMQSANEDELRALGRAHRVEEVERTVRAANAIGLDNVSLDLMLGVPGATLDSAHRSVDAAADCGAKHISAYMLKIEPNTPYGRCTPSVPDDDATADMYLAAMEWLDIRGYRQYEISNTAVVGYESRHNLKYWLSEPYIGIGPAASSYFNGSRFTYSRNYDAFLRGDPPILDADTEIAVGSMQEFACLRLRLNEGVSEKSFFERFRRPIPNEWRERVAKLPPALVVSDDSGLRLTRQGFLVSNSLIRHIFG